MSRQRIIGLTHQTAFISIFVISESAYEQCTYDWRPGQGIPDVNGTVNATTTWDADGAGPQAPLLIVGGVFSIAGNTFVSHIAMWDSGNQGLLQTENGGTIYPYSWAFTVYNSELIAKAVSSQPMARWRNDVLYRGMTLPGQIGRDRRHASLRGRDDRTSQ